MPPKAVSKKRPRTDSNAVEDEKLPPIVFQSPGLKPDTRLQVFKQEFHVHSLILKLHSNYFRKFLDSPDKSGSPASALFHYEYVTVVDDEKSHMWALEAAEKAQVNPAAKFVATEKDWTGEATQVFRKFLCAMYNRPYKLATTSELKELTRLADFYCALPIVSSTLTGALLLSPMFKTTSTPTGLTDMGYHASELIFHAVKLRHAVLFRECFVYIVGCWATLTTPRTDCSPILTNAKLLDDHIITPLIKDAYISHFHMLEAVKSKFINLLLHDLADFDSQVSEFAYNQNARFHRLVDNCIKDEAEEGKHEDVRWLEEKLDILLRNNLVLDQSGTRPGEGVYGTMYLCAEIADENLPWDPIETDW